MLHAKRMTKAWAVFAVVAALAVIFAVAIFAQGEVAYASVGASSYHITLETNKSSGTQSYVASKDADYVLNIPSHDGYYISSLVVDGKELVTSIYSNIPQIDDLNYTASPTSYKFPSVNANHAVVVTYEAKYYNVVFDTVGSDSGNFSQSVKTDEQILPGTVTKKGYILDHWTENGTTAFNMIMPPNDITLTAVWVPATDTKYTIRYYQETLSLTEYEEVEADTVELTGTTGTTVTFTPDKYKYDRFDFDAEMSNTSVTIAPDGSSEIALYYSRGRMVIYFDSMGGTAVQSTSAMPGENISAPSVAPTRAGYAFTAWFEVDRPSAYVFGTMPGRDLHLEAHWRALSGIGYTVKFYKQVSSELGYEEIVEDRITNLTGTSGEAVSYNAVTDKYEDFALQRGKSTLTATLRGDGTTVLSVFYDRARYSVTLNAGKGTVEDVFISVKYNEEITLPTPTRDGYTFAGWYVGSTLVADGSYQFHKAITLEAKWSPIDYTISFDTLGGSDVASQNVVYGGMVTKPETDPTKQNCTFAGWFTDEACTEAVDFEKLTITQDTTLYAKWDVNTKGMLIVALVMFVLLSLAAVIVVSIIRKH